MNPTSITLDAGMNAAYTYTVNDAKLVIPAPTYTNSPNCAGMAIAFIYSVSSSPIAAFVAVNGANIEVYTTDGTKTGVYSVSVTATETNSGLTDTQQF